MSSTPRLRPFVAAIDMGHGHLRAAQPLADAWDTLVVHVDRPPVAEPHEERQWARARELYERTSRATQLPVVGPLVRRLLDEVTAIEHLHPHRDQSAPTRHVRALSRLMRGGLGAGLAKVVADSGRPLVSTYFSAALSADFHGCENVWCVVTDADLARAWVAETPARSRVRYLVPSRRAEHRLRAYGVPRERITFTGFPLPLELVGSPELEILKRNLAARLVRLDTAGAFRARRSREAAALLGPLPGSEQGRAPLVTFAVGGAGAQAELARSFLPGMRPAIESGRLRLALVAGRRADVAERFRDWVREARLDDWLGQGVELLHEREFESYYRAFNELVSRTDVLWTKPSELSFYAALGLPLVLSWPVGVHERYNRRWLTERGAGLRQDDPRHAAEWLLEWLDEGLLAAAALSGFLQLPAAGTHRIVAAVTGGRAAGGVSPARGRAPAAPQPPSTWPPPA